MKINDHLEKNIICLKWGNKYSSQYVNVLYNMCKKHNTYNFNFFCMTENAKELNSEIKIIPLPSDPNLNGWWFKLYVFNNELNFTGQCLFLDLDLIIHNNIDKLWDFNPGSFSIIRDFTRHMNPNWKKYNSSVFKFNPFMHYDIWHNFKFNYKNIMSKNYGDQDYLFHILNGQCQYWPDEWIRSYKWEMRDKNELALINGRRNFTSIKNPIVLPDSCIAVFHGDPNPHEIKDPWVKENWK